MMRRPQLSACKTRIKKSIPLLAEKPSHPFAQLAGQAAIARSDSPGRPLGRRLGASPWTAASTMAAWLCAGRVAFLAVIISTVVLPPIGTANAESAMTPQPSTVTSDDSFANYVNDAAQHFNIPAGWIRAVMHVESDDDTGALSSKGAIGLMQVMTGTYQDMRLRYGLGADPYDPHDNITAGTAYLREMLDCYGMSGFLAAYNAGPEKYDEHLATGQPLPAETRAYVSILMPMIEGEHTGGSTATVSLAIDPLAWTRAPLFVNGTVSTNPNTPESSTSVDRRSPGAQPNRILISSGSDFSALAPQPAGLFIRRTAPGRRR